MEQKQMLISPWAFNMLKVEAAYYQKWMIDLFSPKGIAILFANQKVDG